MATFAMIHGSGDSSWYWHLVEQELRRRGHDTIAPDLPVEDPDAGLTDFADSVIHAVGERDDVVVVGQSSGGFTAAIVAARMPVRLLVFVAGMVPKPGESPYEWFAATGYSHAVATAAEQDGGLTGSQDPYELFFHDVPRTVADEAMSRERTPADDSRAADEPWPLNTLPDVPTKFVLCTEDRFFPPALLRAVAADRLGITDVDEIAAGHCVALSRPEELANILVGYLEAS